MALEIEFQKSLDFISTNYTLLDLTNSDRDKLYGLAKQVVNGDCNIPPPNFFNVLAIKKYNIWKKYRGVSKEYAMIEYINFMSNPDRSVLTLAEHEESAPIKEQRLKDPVKIGPVYGLTLSIC